MIHEIDRYDGDGWTPDEIKSDDEAERLLAEADAAWISWMGSLRKHYGHAAAHRAYDGPAETMKHHPECIAAWCRYCGARDRWQDRVAIHGDPMESIVIAFSDQKGRPKA